MPLLAEYAITPDVFDLTSYSSEEVCGLHLRGIRRVMMKEGLVRDLRGGEWRALYADHGRPWHRWTKEIVRKLANQGRLIDCPCAQVAAPIEDRDWCAEALAGHAQAPMNGGVIVTETVKRAYSEEPLVERVDTLQKAPWWSKRCSSIRLKRQIADYRHNLQPILRRANSLQFIDPHLDPSKPGYSEFPSILAEAGCRKPPPDIEIHRVCYTGSGQQRRILDRAELECVFRGELAAPLRSADLTATVRVWDDFHDRYLISNLIGIALLNGFDTTRKHDDMTTWVRLEHCTRDDIQREFEKGAGRHKLRFEFDLP